MSIPELNNRSLELGISAAANWRKLCRDSFAFSQIAGRARQLKIAAAQARYEPFLCSTRERHCDRAEKSSILEMCTQTNYVYNGIYDYYVVQSGIEVLTFSQQRSISNQYRLNLGGNFEALIEFRSNLFFFFLIHEFLSSREIILGPCLIWIYLYETPLWHVSCKL